MSPTTRVERHVAVDILSSSAGGALVASITLRSWLCAVVAVALAIALYIFDRMNIEEEETPDITPTVVNEAPTGYRWVEDTPVSVPALEQAVTKPRLSEDVVALLYSRAKQERFGVSIGSDVASYANGLHDGVIILAQWAVEEMGDSR